MLRAGSVAVLLVASVSAVVGAVAEPRRRYTVGVSALELSRLAHALRTSWRLVAAVMAVLLSVTPAIKSNRKSITHSMTQKNTGTP